MTSQADASDDASTPEPSSDRVRRAITDDDAFRVMVATTTGLTRQAVARQQATGTTARFFADLLTGTVLIRETMSPAHRLQSLLKGAEDQTSLVADAHPDGLTRGLLQGPPEARPFDTQQGVMLQVMRSMATGKVHRSVVRPPAGCDISQALMTYLQESEQITSVISVGAAWQNDEISHSGGYVVQLLPDADRGALTVMTERLEALPPIDELLAGLGGSAPKLLDELLFQMPHAQLDDQAIHFGCRCSQEAVVASLATLGREDLTELVRDQEVVELTCDYCGTAWPVQRAQLLGLLETS
ncbi:MAG: Hsp33 family molecular chaperone HslO [Deltaproteobacteria bacterium]|nr:Hsp33 family molecular chaperone HslO [Deltaproteobacteria bacterium]